MLLSEGVICQLAVTGLLPAGFRLLPFPLHEADKVRG